MAEFSGEGWRKSSYSDDGIGSACVEVAVGSGRVGVRDSKRPEGGPVLVFGRREFARFAGGVKRS
ncbi:hypothetical protein GCM10027589_03800 [Actinocorallia lasiicapitis]